MQSEYLLFKKKRFDPNKKIGLDALVGRLTTLTTMFLLPKILSLHLKLNSHSKKRARKKKTINQEVRKKVKKFLTVILKFLKPYLQRNTPKVEENTKVKSL